MHRVIIQITPAGLFRPSDGRSFTPGYWTIDDTSAPAVLDAFNARQTARVIDYEHQTLHKEQNGLPAPAAGWMAELHWRPGAGLFASVELTDRAASLIRAGEYRYVSPVLRHDEQGRVLSVEMAALTNSPALDGMAPIKLEPVTAATTHRSLSPGELAVCAATGVAPEAFAAATATATNRSVLSACELAVCAATGIAPEAFAAARATG